ncbi:tetratricopeptide repeat protein [uncultured Amphritea sp.]|uniref:tetratricopeptide repeat protein n=1 Tax=uncultured Amphritea sp. TaxID=981605 RepID=UPI002624A948|nr:tetratricopeptide repeat protein [uncultured Amphritea sp.]
MKAPTLVTKVVNQAATTAATPIAATLVAVLLSLSGCTGQLSKLVADTADTEAVSLPVVEYQPGELNRETLYELIVAEIAGQRKEFDLSLDNYLHQARLTGDPEIAKRATYIAQYLQRNDQLLQASQLWQKADPQNPEPYLVAASLLLRKGDFTEALPLLRKALQHSDKQTLMIISAQADKLTPEENDAYVQLLEEQAGKETDATLLTTLGILYALQGNNEKALQRFDAAIADDASYLEAVLQKAELLRAAGHYRKAIKVLEPQMDADQPDQQLFTLYVQLLFQSKQTKKAVQQALLLVETFPEEPQLTFYTSLLLLENDQVEQSREIMQDLLQRYPDNTTPHYYLGLIEQHDGNNEKAIAHFIKVKDSNNILQAYRRIAALLDHPNNRDRLQGILQDARNNMPEIDIQLYAMEAEWLNLHDFKDAALSMLDEALQQHPNDSSLLYTRAMTLDPQDINLIEKDLRQVLRLEPDNSMALNALGYTLSLYTDRFDEAYELINKALQLSPNDPAILDSMGWVLLKQGKAADAVSFLQQAYDLFPDPEVSAHLIQAYHAAGNQQQALNLLKKEQLKHPDNEYLQEAATSINAPQE